MTEDESVRPEPARIARRPRWLSYLRAAIGGIAAAICVAGIVRAVSHGIPPAPAVVVHYAASSVADREQNTDEGRARRRRDLRAYWLSVLIPIEQSEFDQERGYAVALRSRDLSASQSIVGQAIKDDEHAAIAAVTGVPPDVDVETARRLEHAARMFADLETAASQYLAVPQDGTKPRIDADARYGSLDLTGARVDLVHMDVALGGTEGDIPLRTKPFRITRQKHDPTEAR